MSYKINKDKNSTDKIAIFLQNLDEGGAERAISQLSGQIANLGFTVDLVVGDADSRYRDEISSRVNIVNFATRSPLKLFKQLIIYLRCSQPLVIMSSLDIANIILYFAVKLSRYRGRVVVSQRAVINASQYNLPILRKFIIRQLQRISFHNADAVISNSYSAANDVKLMFGISEEKVFTIHNAVDIKRIKRLAEQQLKNPWYLNDKSPLIVSVGSLTPRKDLVTLIKAFAIVKSKLNVRLAIIGEAQNVAERQKLKRIIVNLGLNDSVYLAGFDSNPYKWINRASVFVSSSLGEGFPNVIAEALTLNCPIVATDCPGDTSELLEYGKWGRLVPVKNPKIMSDAIIGVLNSLNHPDGCARAADFSQVNNVVAYLKILIPELDLSVLGKRKFNICVE